MDALAALRLQIEWGADEALAEMPVDRLHPTAAARAVPPDRPSPGPAPSPGSAPSPAPAPAARATPLDRARHAAANAATLDALKQAIAAFDGCVLRDTAAHTVLPEGPPGALLLIGEAPSGDDDRAGRPFAGPTGAYLDKLLASIGLQRDGLLVAPLVPWRPPGDRPPSQTELGLCLPFLMRLITLSRPPLILALGPLVSRTLGGPAMSRRTRRGTWIDLPVPEIGSVRMLTTHGIAALLGQPGLRRDAWADLRALRRAQDALIAAK
jgi:DNA polymerase